MYVIVCPSNNSCGEPTVYGPYPTRGAAEADLDRVIADELECDEDAEVVDIVVVPVTKFEE